MQKITLLALFLSAPATAQELSSDRPDFSWSTQTVAPSDLILEAGLAYDLSQSSITLPQLLVRTGITDSLEFRITAPDISLQDQESAFGAASVGVKYATEVNEQIRIGLLPSIALPVTGEDRELSGIQSGLAFLWSLDTDTSVGIYGSLGTQARGIGGESGELSFEHFASMTLGWSVNDSISLFAEGYSLIGESTDIYADAGIIYLLKPTLQLDFYGGVPIADPSAAWIGFGISTFVDG